MCLKRTVLGCLILIALPLAQLRAANLQVDCDHPGVVGRLSSIGAALKLLGGPLGLIGPNTITVSGACNENVLIQSAINLTITAQPGASITDVSGGTMPAVDVERSTNVAINGFVISGGGGLFGAAMACANNSTCATSSNDVKNSGVFGVSVNWGSSLTSYSDVAENNGVFGLLVDLGSHATVGNGTFRNNGIGGIDVSDGSSIALVSSSVSGNGVSVGGWGISVTDHSQALINDGTITGNGNGGGVTVQTGSEARFYPVTKGSTVSGNGGPGVYVADLSLVNFDINYAIPTVVNSVSGNGAAPDIDCAAATSVALRAAANGPTNCK